MARYSTYKKILAGALAVGVCLLSGCVATVDNREDPLAGYTVDSVLPFPTNAVVPTPTVAPQVTLAPSVKPVDQSWQNDNQLGQNTNTQPVTQNVPLERLEMGASSEAVRQLQQRLIDLGYLSGTADGNFGSNTKTAVKRFQAALGLSQTGVATVTLQEKLFLNTAPTYSPSLDTGNNSSVNSGEIDSPYKTLIRGDKGDEVKQLQSRLIALGYLSGAADGSFGGQTENAVKRFQAALGLTQSGVASAALQQSLFSSNAPVAVATKKPTQAPTKAPTPPPSDQGGTATSGYVDLEYGDKNDAVKRLQERLKELGYFSNTATGKYFSETEAAVKRFQATLGLTQTGVATASLQTKLFASNAPAYAAQATKKPTATQQPNNSEYTMLSYGSQGEEVRSLQKRLIALGYLAGKADGDYGRATENAVKLFQKTIGYNENGAATESVQEYLFSPYAPYYEAPEATKAPDVPAPPTAKPVQTEYAELNYGMSGDSVKKLQQRLQELGYFNGSIGGNYLERTQAAIELFQRANGWNEDGVATVVLQQYLFSQQAPAYDHSLGNFALQEGDEGNQVKRLQQRLIDLGYLSGRADGDYGAKTANAVKAFQNDIGLDATGKATVETQDYLFSKNAPTAKPTVKPTNAPTVKPSAPPVEPSGYQTLNYGMSGDAVKDIQQRLKDLGYFEGKVLGNYKELTQSAVKAFQQAAGWPADGIATPELQEYLFSSNAPAAGSTPKQPEQEDKEEEPGEYRKLMFGDESSAVKRLQQRLVELNWLSDTADGEFGQNTLNAVLALQYRFGMEQTGIATPELQQRLFGSDAPVYVEFIDLQFGSMGAEVTALQQRLIDLGYLRDRPENLDGEYGEGTQNAVASVQQAMGLIDEQVNGIASIEFQTFLYSDFALVYAIPKT